MRQNHMQQTLLRFLCPTPQKFRKEKQNIYSCKELRKISEF